TRMMDGQAIAMTVAVDQPPADVAARLGALFDLHHQRLFRLARRLSRSADDARDLVQETFLRAARAPGSIPEGASHEEAWLVGGGAMKRGGWCGCSSTSAAIDGGRTPCGREHD